MLINLITDNFLLFLTMIFCFFIHEMGHILFIYLKKGKVNHIEINAFGAVISTDLVDDLLVDFGRHSCKYIDMPFNISVNHIYNLC